MNSGCTFAISVGIYLHILDRIMARTKQTAQKSTGGMANRGRSVRFSQPEKPKEEPGKLDDPGTPKKKPDPKQRPKLVFGSKKHKTTPMKREERTMRQIREARKRVELCMPHLPLAR